MSINRFYLALLLTSALAFSCQSRSKRTDTAEIPAVTNPAPENPTPESVGQKNIAEQVHDSMAVTLKKDGKEITETKVISPDASAAQEEKHKRKSGPVEWSKAMGWLKNGNTRFAKGFFRKDGQGKKDVQRLSKGQQPHSIVLSCSDSRVPPELVFDQKLGEIFVVRVAGEVLDSSAVASIEYAIDHLGSNLIVVMGHTSCGAVKAAVATLSGGTAGSVDLDRLVAGIHPHIKPYAGKTPSNGYMKESWANVKGVAKDLLQKSLIVQEAVHQGDVKITEAMYDMESGVVTFWQ